MAMDEVCDKPDKSREEIARRVKARGYEPGQLQWKWRTDPPVFVEGAEWFAEAEDALLDVLCTMGWQTVSTGDGTSCATQIIEAFARRAANNS